jgi:small GTP-binding protein
MDNQAFQLTPPGMAAIAVVRLLGPGVDPFLSQHFSRTPRVGRCVHGNLSDGDRVIDDPVVVLLPDGGADISLHGGPWVVRSTLDLARRDGFAIIETSAHTPTPSQAVNAKNAIESEIEAWLPLARTELAIRALLAQAAAWAQLDIPPSPAVAARMIGDRSLYHLLHPPTVAVVGPANVGKSTLANWLFGQERSITADIAGTTRDWVGEFANVDGLPVMLVDTPGQRPTDDAIEQSAIAASRERIEASQFIVLVLDASRPLEPEQSHLLAMYPNAQLVVNKCDRPWVWDVARTPAIQTTATTGGGVDALRRAIAGYFGCADLDINQPRCWTARQREIMSVQEPTTC